MNIEFSKKMQKEFQRRIRGTSGFSPKKKKKRGTSGCTLKGNCNVGCFLIHGANTIKSNAED